MSHGVTAGGEAARIHLLPHPVLPRKTMSEPAHTPDHATSDPAEEVVKYIPVVLPAVGAVMMFLLAFIAVYMA